MNNGRVNGGNVKPLDIFASDLRPMQFWHTKTKARVELWRQGIVEGYSTGFKDIDKRLRLVDGELVIVAGRPSQGKCLGYGTRVWLHDGTLVEVQDVVEGDLLLGPDSKPRRVLSTTTGREKMYKIHQTYGMTYRVNESHILSLRRSKIGVGWEKGEVINQPVSALLNKGPGFFSRFSGYKVGADFVEKDVPIEPYFFGLWLGDGSSSSAVIYNTDQEVIDYLHDYAERRQEYVVEKDKDRPCSGYLITGGRSHLARDGSLASGLTRLCVMGNKHIPKLYLVNSEKVRLELLAGLLDSDGYYSGHYVSPKGKNAGNYYEIVQSNMRLAGQIKMLADTLGFRTNIRPKKARIKKNRV